MPGAQRSAIQPKAGHAEPDSTPALDGTPETRRPEVARLAAPAGPPRPGRLTPARVLNMQRTVGNQTVLRMLDRRRAGPAAAIQRKFSTGIFKGESKTLSERMRKSDWDRLRDLYNTYQQAPPEQELSLLIDLRQKTDDWITTNQTSKSRTDRTRMISVLSFKDEIEAEIQRELAAFSTKTGLSMSLLLDMLDGSVRGKLELLVQADRWLEAGLVGKADQALTDLEGMLSSGFSLIKAALLRTHIGTINPVLAAMIQNPDYEQKDDHELSQKSKTAFKDDGNAKNHEALYQEYKDDSLNPQAPDPADPRAASKQTRQAKIMTEKKMVDFAAIDSLTKREKDSIFQYTSGTFTDLNTSLRNMSLGGLHTSRGDNSGANIFQFTEDKLGFTGNAISALNKLPPYLGEVYRHDRLFPGFEDVYRVGAVVSDMAFTSTTYLAASLQATFGTDILTIIQSKSGRFIKPISLSQGEDEVMFKPGTRFRVNKVVKAQLDPKDAAYRGWPANLDPRLMSILQADPHGKKIKYIVVRDEV